MSRLWFDKKKNQTKKKKNAPQSVLSYCVFPSKFNIGFPKVFTFDNPFLNITLQMYLNRL